MRFTPLAAAALLSAVAPAAAQERGAPIPEIAPDPGAETVPLGPDPPGVRPEAAPLRLAEVLANARATHPDLRAALAKIRAAGGALTAARGAWDTRLGTFAEAHPWTKKPYGNAQVSLTQPTRWRGLEFIVGWYVSTDYIPVYKDQAYFVTPNYLTAYKGDPLADSAGRAFAGVTAPLLRGGATDKRRAELAKARAKRERSILEARAKALELGLKASDAYWGWVAAGRAAELARELLEMALERQDQLNARVEAGSLAPIAATEGLSSVFKRRTKVIETEQKLRDAALKLAQYIRTAPDGPPIAPSPARLPERWPPVEVPTDPEVLDAARRARQNLPALTVFEADREAIQAEIDLAENDALPELNLTGAVAQSVDDRTSHDARVGLGISIPLQLREARGRRTQAEAQLLQLDAELRRASDVAALQVLRASNELDGAAQRVEVARDQVRTMNALVVAERERFDAGLSTLFVVNQREQAAFDAALELAEAQRDLHTARATYDAARGAFVIEPLEE